MHKYMQIIYTALKTACAILTNRD